MIAVDTGPLFALFDRADRDHDAAKRWMMAVGSEPLVTTGAVITEVALMLQPSVRAHAAFLRWAGPSIDVDSALATDLPRIAAIVEKYADLPADFADASLIALCERRGLDKIATLDRDFEIYRLPKGRRFKNVMRPQ